MKHWRPDSDFVPLEPADAAEWARIESQAPATESPVPAGAAAGLALVAAACLGLALVLYAAVGPRHPVAAEAEAGDVPYFGDCPAGGGRNCVMSGDTFDMGGVRIRIAGIDAPRLLGARCLAEERLGRAAARRLRELLNSGLVSVAGSVRDKSGYGPERRRVRVNGVDAGSLLIRERVALPEDGSRPNWC